MLPERLFRRLDRARLDGTLTRRAVAGAPTRRIPALALTAFARPEDRKRAILAGYQSHIAKPFDMAELVIVVAGLLGRT
jgi:CheY-like chemotaxis protein